jgi:protein-disulfide isomerase
MSAQAKRLAAVVVAAAAIVIVLIIVSSGGGGGSTKTNAGGAVAGARQSRALLAGIPQKGIVLGNPHAPVTMVEFADLQCPFCRNYTLNVLPALVRSYVRTGKVRMEFRNISFIGPDSQKLARAAGAAAQQDKLWNFLDLVYHNQGRENSGYATEAFIRRILGAVPGLDVQRALAARDTAAVKKQLDTALTLARRAGVRGTPWFLLGRSGATLATLNLSAIALNQFTGPIDRLLKR